MRRVLPMFFLLTLLVMVSSCSTTEYVAIKPELPSLPTISEAISEETLNGIHKPLDLIPEPKTAKELLYNLSEYRAGYINWRTYATALEEYYTNIAEIINGNKEDNYDDIPTEAERD